MCAGYEAVAEEAKILGGPEVRRLLSGTTLHITKPNRTSMPVAIRSDGTLFARSGDLAGHLGSKSDTGYWWVSESSLCFQWRKWLRSAPHCVHVFRTRSRVLLRSADGSVMSARLVTSNRNLAHRVRQTQRSGLGRNAQAYQPPRSERPSQGSHSAQSYVRSIVVREGDTLYGLARHYRISVYDLAAANRLQTSQIVVGQTLMIPSGR